MPVNRSIPTTRADPKTSTSGQVIDHRLRSEAAAAAGAASNPTSGTGALVGKEVWQVGAAGQTKEFGATLGKPTFDRVTGTYTPRTASPSWDTGTVPFHRSTPSAELDIIIQDDAEVVEGVSPLTTRPPVRLDISAGNGTSATAAGGTRPKVTQATSLAGLTFGMPRQGTRSKSPAMDTSVEAVLTVSSSMPVVTSSTMHARSQPISTTNPFGTPSNYLTITAPSRPGGGGAAGGIRGDQDFGRIGVSPIPSIGENEHRPAASTISTYMDRGLEQGMQRGPAYAETIVAKGNYLTDVFVTEFEGLNVNSYTPAMLQELCTEANAHKKSIARVEEKLLCFPQLARQRAEFAATRGNFVDFIRRAQRRICEGGEAGRRPQPRGAAAPTPRSVSTLSIELKRDRVLAQEHRLIDEMSGVIEEAKALQKEDPGSDTQVKSLCERCGALKERVAELAKEAMALYGDAVDAELGSPAKAIHDCMQLMQSTARDASARLNDLKVSARIGLGGGARDVDFPAPTFGGGSDEDVYKFLDLFDQFIDARAFSDTAALRALRTVNLKGQLAITCADMDSLPEIRSYLLDVYGQPRVLLDSRLKEVMKLGKCPNFPAEKRRDWMIKMQNQLNYLLKICRKFHLVDELMFSPVLKFVHDNLPHKIHQDYLEAMANIPREERTRRRLFNETVAVVAKQVLQASADVNTNHVLGMREVERLAPKKSINVAQVVDHDDLEVAEAEDEEEVVAVEPAGRSKRQKTRKGQREVARPLNESAHPLIITAEYTEPSSLQCVACPAKHTHMFYCPVFQKAGMDDRIQIAKAQGACRRCLRSDSKLDLSDRRAWFARHEKDCKTEWTCKYEWTCGKAGPNAQIHMLLCKRHSRHNRELEDQFVKSLDRTQLSGTPRFFFSNFSVSTRGLGESEMAGRKDEAGQVVPATAEQAIYMLQTAYNVKGETLLLFYDSGCSVAAISQKASHALDSCNIVPGPFDLNVAGGQVVRNKGGLDEFSLGLFDDNGIIQMRGLVMDKVTNPFAKYDLLEAYQELCAEYGQGEGAALPQVPEAIGGSEVDVMVGIKYLAHFPELVFSLPSGLAIFETKIRTMCGRRGVIGGPHRSWAHASTQIEYMSAYAFLSAELRAYQAQAAALDVGWGAWDVGGSCKPWLDDESDCSCWCHAGISVLSLQEQARRFEEVERVGSELTYRCIKCRNCADCRRGELLEEASLQEEAEQALIEASVWLEPERGRLVCRLPFIKEPASVLQDNRQQAEKIFASQMRSFGRNQQMKEAVLAAHDKLLSRGHVVAVADLPADERAVFEATPGAYVLPWSCVSKVDSVSTPYRVVFNASFKTRSGESLNTVLAKGANKLPLILSLLLRFSSRQFALAADVSMAYNAVKLVPEHFRYQQYLWRENLDEDKPIIPMVIRTLIYGVRPSGNLTGAGFVRVADYAQQHFPHLAKGAKVIRDDTYVDDSVASFNSLSECKEVAVAMSEVLSLGGAAIKDFAFSTIPPSDKLSTDGVHVGVLGYAWDTVAEMVYLAVRPTVLGKGRKANQVEGEEGLWEALRCSFTKRTLQGQLARIYDPKGLATPVTALIKLDLAEIVALKTGWDDPLPDRLLEKWVNNLIRIHRLRKIPFPRAVIGPGVSDSMLDLIVSVDASKDVAVAAVHARSRRDDGSFGCRLLVAKSKLVHTHTIPRGELRAAAMGAALGYAVACDLGDQVRSVTFVSDSTIVLYWMAHDSRPLQTAVRNAVIEIRRLSRIDRWFHVSSEDNVADLGTRYLDVAEVGPTSEWVLGRPWMSWPEDRFPLRSIDQVALDAEEARLAAKEIKVSELGVHSIDSALDKVADRYRFSRYVVDPCNAEWPKAVNVAAMVFRFVKKLQQAVQRRKEGNPLVPVPKHLRVVLVTAEERQAAEDYFFRKATGEVKHFQDEKDFSQFTIEKDGILLYKSRVLDGQVVEDHDGILGDVRPLHFVRPVVDRFSPVAYSVMRHVHDRVAKHMNPVVTLRESREICFVIKGRDLANEIAKLCHHCKKLKAVKVENEMAAQHPSTLSVGAAFSKVQVDMAGPWFAECEHSCRSTVKVWAAVFKDPATCAVAAYAMPASNSAGFVQAYNRHAFRHGHPVKVYVDAGSQLLKACEKAEMSWFEISHLISAHYGVGFDYEVCPPHAHYFHGAVERSIKEIKRLFNNTFQGLKLHLLAFETALAFCTNQLNNLPITLGTRVDHLGHRDVLTPNRLIMGRNNKRSPSSITQVPSNSRLAEQLESIEKSWWKMWEAERLVDFVPQPAKWSRTNNSIAVGAVVIFPMAKPKSPIGELMWKYGKVAEILPSRDGLARKIKITYQNYKEEVWRSVTRGAREVAVIHEEEDLEFFRMLREEAAKTEKEKFEPRMAWQGVPHEEDGDEADVVGDHACACINLA